MICSGRISAQSSSSTKVSQPRQRRSNSKPPRLRTTSAAVSAITSMRYLDAALRAIGLQLVIDLLNIHVALRSPF